jgi:CheY-like chemotaxis protein
MPATVATLRVLLVEDHFATRNALAIWLEDLGHQVEAVETVSHALEVAAHRDFDVLISDIGLPDGDGRDLVRQLKQTHQFRAIAISGMMIGPAERESSRQAGFIAHLEKPFNPMDLEQTLRAVA